MAFNQRYEFLPLGKVPGTRGTLSSVTASPYYCMTAPVATTDPVRYTPCTGNNRGPANTNPLQQWVFTGKIDGDYDHSYTIINNGLCLSLRGADGTYDTPYSTIQLATCDGSDMQKWNAPAGPLATRLQGVGEEQRDR